MAKGSGSTKNNRPNVKSSDYKSKMVAYNQLIDDTGKWWQTLSDDQKDSLYSYTDSSGEINYRLKSGEYGKFGDSVDDTIKNIISALDKTSLPAPRVVQRTAKNESSVYGISLSNASFEEIKGLVGKEFTAKQFMSTQSHTSTEYGSGKTKIVMTLPKGTKGAYVEPFSSFGQGSGRSWNGKDRQTFISNENEFLLKNNSTFRVDKVKDLGKGYKKIYVTVVKQDGKKLV